MQKPRILLFLASVAAVVVISHVVWSSALAALMKGTYDHRLPNLAKIKDPAVNWIPMISIYSRNIAQQDASAIVFVGSSFTFGFPQPSSIIFSQVLQRLSGNRTVANLSIPAADQTGLAVMVGCALAEGQRNFDINMLELPVLNDNSQARSVVAQGGTLSADLDLSNCPTSHERTWLEYFLRRPYGSQWVPLLRDESFLQAQPRKLQFPPDYIVNAETYRGIADQIASARQDYIRLMARFARKTLVYPSLIQVDALVEHGFDRTNIERQIDDALVTCRKVDNVICLDTRSFLSRGELFHDAAHLNARGHEIFGEWLFHRIQPLIAKPGA